MADQFERLKTALADRYAIEREIGSGGMVTVYLAEDLSMDRTSGIPSPGPASREARCGPTLTITCNRRSKRQGKL